MNQIFFVPLVYLFFKLKSRIKGEFFLLVLLLCFQSIMSAQNQREIDSLQVVFENTNDLEIKLQVAAKLFQNTLHFNKEQSLSYVRQRIALAEKHDKTLALADSYADLAMYYRFSSQADSSRFYYEKALELFNSEKPSEEQVSAYDDYATLEAVEGDYDKSVVLLDTGYTLAEKLKSGKGMAAMLRRKGSVLTDMAKYEAASKTMIKATRILDTLKNPEVRLKGIILGQTGRIEMIRENYDTATRFFEESITHFDSVEDSEWLALVYNEMGNMELSRERIKEAEIYYKQALPEAEKVGKENLLAIVYANLSRIYYEQEDYSQALAMLDQSMELKEKNGSVFNQIIGHNEYGQIYRKTRDLQRSIASHTTAITMADSTNTFELLMESYEGRSQSYEVLGDYEAALSDFKQVKALSDTLNQQKFSKEIDELRAIYDKGKSEKEIAILKQKELEASNRQRLLILILIALVILAGLIYYAFRQKIKRQRAEQEILASNLHFKEKELTTHALNLAHKNEVLLKLKSQIKDLKKSGTPARKYQDLLNSINIDINNDSAWEQFRLHFEDLHKDFNTEVINRYPGVSANELRLISLLKMNLSSKEIAHILNISLDGVKKARYRLRKKMDLSTEDSLEEVILKL